VWGGEESRGWSRESTSVTSGRGHEIRRTRTKGWLGRGRKLWPPATRGRKMCGAGRARRPMIDRFSFPVRGRLPSAGRHKSGVHRFGKEPFTFRRKAKGHGTMWLPDRYPLSVGKGRSRPFLRDGKRQRAFSRLVKGRLRCREMVLQ
jgi:hypothetical protein